jgi:ABC-type multidrug transport system fused ATPase/permease subunit
MKPRHLKDVPNPKAFNVQNADIRFKNVSFSYKDQNHDPGLHSLDLEVDDDQEAQKKIFENLDLYIPAGQKVGLIGPSGAGKSSLVSLLMRFYDIQKGQILIDGFDIASVGQRELRKHIAVIPQDTSLFHRSLMDNIRYGDQSASDKDVIEAAKRAYAHEFIEVLPEGYNTMVGERGVRLSGGQRQRIAIARAILKDAPILVLDEATSALDSESEQKIQQALNDIMVGKTVIAIAHRLSTIKSLDRLIVMDDGRITQDGSHKDLLQNPDSLYAKLWSMQTGEFLKA